MEDAIALHRSVRARLSPEHAAKVAATLREVLRGDIHTFTYLIGSGSTFGYSAEAYPKILEEISADFRGATAAKYHALVFGGDPAREDAPDVGLLVLDLKRKFPDLTVIAVQTEAYAPAVAEMDHVDKVVPYRDVFDPISKKRLYAGWSRHFNGNRTAVGATAQILDYIRPAAEDRSSHLHVHARVAGGGPITADEVDIFNQVGVRYVYFPVESRVPRPADLMERLRLLTKGG